MTNYSIFINHKIKTFNSEHEIRRTAPISMYFETELNYTAHDAFTLSQSGSTVFREIIYCPTICFFAPFSVQEPKSHSTLATVSMAKEELAEGRTPATIANEDGDDEDLERANEKWYQKITVEPTMFLYMLAYMITSVMEQAFFVYKACTVDHGYSAEICNNIQDKNYTDINKKVQITVSTFYQWNNVLGHIVPIVLAFYLGAWSDKRGRKIPLLMGLVGKLYYSVMVVINSYQRKIHDSFGARCRMIVYSVPIDPISCSQLASKLCDLHGNHSECLDGRRCGHIRVCLCLHLGRDLGQGSHHARHHPRRVLPKHHAHRNRPG